jgi:hypothetical protein
MDLAARLIERYYSQADGVQRAGTPFYLQAAPCSAAWRMPKSTSCRIRRAGQIEEGL